MLGIDHVGHTHGSFHPAMDKKLLQLDNILNETINSLDNETILIVLGDHGMNN
jgi:phosphatidylinositol glycan class O